MSSCPDTRGAFSLIELLIVIAIIAVLSALAVPAFNSIRGAGSLTKGANDIAGIIEQARTYAMAQNTYVWVGFRKDGADTLIVGVIASKTGSSNPANDVVQLSRTTRFENMQLVALPNSGARPATNVDQLNGASDSELAFTIGTNSFNSQVIRWNSRGEARINSARLSRLIEIGLQASAGGTIRNASNTAAVQIGGLSGNGPRVSAMRAMTPKFHHGLTLVEVTLALGIITFGLIAVMSLLPTGLRLAKQSADEVAAVNIMTAISVSLEKAGSAAHSGNAFFNADGVRIAAIADATYAASWAIRSNSVPRTALITVAWPATTSNSLGSVESIVVVSQPPR